MHFLMLTRFVYFSFKKFRDALNDCQLPDSEDVYLIRWLIGIVFILQVSDRSLTLNYFCLFTARDFDLAKAEKMFRNVYKRN